MTRVPFLVSTGPGQGRRRRIVGGCWVASDEDGTWALTKEWRVGAGGYVFESGRGGRLASRLIKERERGYPLLSDEDVHHRDKDKLNNQRQNLEVKEHGSHTLGHNREGRSNGLPPGVSLDRKRYRARIKTDGVSRNLGTFDTPEEASSAYQQALKEED